LIGKWDSGDDARWDLVVTALALGIDPSAKARVDGMGDGSHIDVFSLILLKANAKATQALWWNPNGWRPNPKQARVLISEGLFSRPWGDGLGPKVAREMWVWTCHQAGESHAWPFIEKALKEGHVDDAPAHRWFMAAGAKLVGMAQRSERGRDRQWVSKLALAVLAGSAESLSEQELEGLAGVAQAGGAPTKTQSAKLCARAALVEAPVAAARLSALAKAGVPLGLSTKFDSYQVSLRGLPHAESFLPAEGAREGTVELLHPAWGQFIGVGGANRTGFHQVARALDGVAGCEKLWPSWRVARNLVGSLRDTSMAQEAAAAYLEHALEDATVKPDGEEEPGSHGMASLLVGRDAPGAGFEAFVAWASASGRLGYAWPAGAQRVKATAPIGEMGVDGSALKKPWMEPVEKTLGAMAKDWAQGYAVVEKAHLSQAMAPEAEEPVRARRLSL
jgi:hypothetical protein